MSGYLSSGIRTQDNDAFNFDDFLSLHISVSLDSTKYAFITMFLARVLNLKDENAILNDDSPFQPSKPDPELAMEVVPQVIVPELLWLCPSVLISNAKIKIAVLENANALLGLCVEALQLNELFLLDEAAVAYCEHQINSHRLLEYNPRDSEPNGVTANGEVPSTNDVLPKNTKTTPNQQYETLSLFSRPVSTASSRSINLSRILTFSKEFIHSKKKFSFHGHNQSPIMPVAEESSQTAPSTPPPALPQLASPPVLSSRDSYSSLLSKSRIYNKIKRRGLQALVSTDTPPQTTASISPTTMLKSPAESRPGLFLVSRIHLADVRKDKKNYYTQVRLLSAHTLELSKFLGRLGSRANLVRLMEFVKNYIFKMIIVDFALMTLQYCRFRAHAP